MTDSSNSYLFWAFTLMLATCGLVVFGTWRMLSIFIEYDLEMPYGTMMVASPWYTGTTLFVALSAFAFQVRPIRRMCYRPFAKWLLLIAASLLLILALGLALPFAQPPDGLS